MKQLWDGWETRRSPKRLLILNREYIGNMDPPNAPFIAPSIHHRIGNDIHWDAKSHLCHRRSGHCTHPASRFPSPRRADRTWQHGGTCIPFTLANRGETLGFQMSFRDIPDLRIPALPWSSGLRRTSAAAGRIGPRSCPNGWECVHTRDFCMFPKPVEGVMTRMTFEKRSFRSGNIWIYTVYK